MSTFMSNPLSQPDRLDNKQIDQFEQSGFLVLPGIIPRDLVTRVKPEVDRWVDLGLRSLAIAAALNPETNDVPAVMEIDLPAHGELLAYEPLLQMISQLLSPRFVFHHMHSNRHGPDTSAKPWHHDYEHRTQSRTHAMIHVLHYLDGISPDMAGLAVFPGSHREVARKDARAHLGCDVLPGETYIEELPIGSSVHIHSALFHTRRPKPQSASRPRYFVDASYCQVGTLWQPAKPHWREMLSRARQHGLASDDWPDLFAEQHFTEYMKPE